MERQILDTKYTCFTVETLSQHTFSDFWVFHVRLLVYSLLGSAPFLGAKYFQLSLNCYGFFPLFYESAFPG